MRITHWILPRMRDVLYRICRGNQHTHFMFSNFSFFENRVVRQFRKLWLSQKGHKWHHSMAHTSCMLDNQGYMHARVCTWTRARAHTHAQTLRQKYVIFIAFPRQQWSRTRLSITFYVHWLSCCFLCLLYMWSEVVFVWKYAFTSFKSGTYNFYSAMSPTSRTCVVMVW